MKTRPKIAVLGSLIYDCVVFGKRLPRKGETVFGHSNGFNFGGKGGNQAVQAARLGAEVYFIGRVGNDDVGEKLVDSLREDGINTDYIVIDKETPTGTCCIFVDDNGDNAIMVVPHANLKVTRADIDAAMPVIKECDIFISQLEVTIDVIEYAVKKVHDAGIKVLLNPAPAGEIPKDIFRNVDYLTPNETEAEFFCGILPNAKDEGLCRQATKKLLGSGAKNVIMTLGSGGAYYAGPENQFLVPAYKINAIDATAAGDAFNAGFAVRIAEGQSVRNAIMYGNAAGAVAASKSGAQPSLGDKIALEQFISKNDI